MADDPARIGRWTVGPPLVDPTEPWARWSAELDGAPVAFDVLGLTPSTRPEAALTFAGPLALAAGADLAAEVTVDPRWRAGFTRALGVLAPWLGADRVPELIGVSEAITPSVATGRTALCFTGGVDSFWTLLRGGHEPTDLLYVLGYDYGLGAEDLVAAQIGSVNAVAAAVGVRPLLVSTDARRHHRATPALWNFHHGAALVAAAMVLSDHVDALVIPSSYPETGLIPWGTRPDLDHLWSIPEVLEVRHGQAAKGRLDLIFDIAEEPLVHDHLAVCWERKGPGVNCGRCEKCVRTMVALDAAGVLGQVRTFPTVDLPAAIAALAPVPAHDWPFWRQLAGDRTPRRLRLAAEALLAASGADTSAGPGG